MGSLLKDLVRQLMSNRQDCEGTGTAAELSNNVLDGNVKEVAQEEIQLPDGPENVTVGIVRPARVRTLTTAIQSPHTDKGRGKGKKIFKERVDHNPIPIISDFSPERQLAFRKWSGRHQMDASVNLEFCRMTKLQLMNLISNKYWLKSEEVEYALWLLRKRCRDYPYIFEQRVCVLDTDFSQYLVASWNGSTTSTVNGQVVRQIEYNEFIPQYMAGSLPAIGRPWIECNQLLIPHCVGQSHWILFHIDLLLWKLIVYDNDHNCYSDQRIQEEASPHCNLVPDLIRRFGIELQRPEFARAGPLDYERMSCTELPQCTQDGHCGLFMVKYVECILAGIPVNSVTFDRMPFFRKKLVIDFFHKEFYFEKDRYIGVAELGAQFHDFSDYR